MYKSDKKYKCLIFDLDGTLLDSASPIANSVIAAAKINSLPIPDIEKVKEGIGRSFDSQYINLFINNYSEDQAEYSYSIKNDFRSDFRVIYAQQKLSLFAGAKELLEQLLIQNYELAIATNGPRSMLNRVLQHLSLREYFAVTGCVDEFIAKPDPQMLMHILLEMGHSSSDAIMIGDSLADIKAAENAAIDSILIESHHVKNITTRCDPTFIVKDLRDIINII